MIDLDGSGIGDLSIGKHVKFGKNVRFLGGGENSKLHIGDYTKIHDDCLILATGSVTIGEACWFGERTVIDGTGRLEIGNFVGVGIGSALYSHIKHGDTLEGSNYLSKGELVIGDDAWLVGQCLVSPVNIGEKSMAMLGSVVVKDMAPYHVYGGNPAVDITEKVKTPWVYVSDKDKLNRLQKFFDDGGWDRCHAVLEWPDKFHEDRAYYNVSTREYVAGEWTEHWHPRVHWELIANTFRFKARKEP